MKKVVFFVVLVIVVWVGYFIVNKYLISSYGNDKKNNGIEESVDSATLEMQIKNEEEQSKNLFEKVKEEREMVVWSWANEEENALKVFGK